MKNALLKRQLEKHWYWLRLEEDPEKIIDFIEAFIEKKNTGKKKLVNISKGIKEV